MIYFYPAAMKVDCNNGFESYLLRRRDACLKNGVVPFIPYVPVKKGRQRWKDRFVCFPIYKALMNSFTMPTSSKR
jgi:hypothetical protein